MGVPYSPREQVSFEWLCLNLFAGDLREKTIFSMAQKLLEVNLWRKLSMSIPCFPGFCVDFPPKKNHPLTLPCQAGTKAARGGSQAEGVAAAERRRGRASRCRCTPGGR